MQFSQYSIDKIFAGQKTQTRRIVKPGDTFDGGLIVHHNGRIKYQVEQTYAICPGRGKPQIARFRLLSIRREDVRQISYADALAEGFDSEEAFLNVWVRMHDTPMMGYPLVLGVNQFNAYKVNTDFWYEILSRPAERYDAWALKFELIKKE